MQSFYNEFFRIFGIRCRSVAHYEYPVKKRLGKCGYADLLWPDVLLVEHKSAGRDLDQAYDQASDYFDGMREKDRPRFILVCDFQTFELRDLEKRREVAFGLQELPDHIHEFEFILEAAHGQEEWKASAFVLPCPWEEKYPTNLGSVEAMSSKLEAASAEVLNWPRSLPGGDEIERPELVELESRIEASTRSTSAVLGGPGSGKSALVSTLAHRYIERGWPVLAIKADMLDADISAESGLQEHLGLDAKPSDFLEQLTETGPVLLILDQVDALAEYIDLRTARLSVLLNLVRRLGRTHNMHIVVASRTFEFQHDSRLKSVAAESLSVELPPWSEVLQLLKSHGVHAAGWPQDAQEVMRSPQALATYLSLHGRRASESFTSYQTMLDRLWKERVLEHDEEGRRSLLATEIANRMAEEESLWLATARFDENTRDIDALESAGILTTLDRKVGFTHQTLFDYALARNFAREPERLGGYVLERQESLFLRPKLWAALTYLHDAEPNAYHGEIQAIWNAPDLRRHLRYLLIDFIGQQAEPTDREALLMEQALKLPGERWPAYRAVAGSPGWFERFRHTFIADSMCESDEAADAMVNVLARAWPFAEDDVVDLMKEHWAPDPNNDLRSWMVIYNAPRWSDAALEVACTIVGRSEIAQHFIDYTVEAIGVEQPEMALHLVRARLDRDLAVAEARAEDLPREVLPEGAGMEELVDWELNKNPRIPINRLIDQGQGWESLSSLAEHAPNAFLDILWPWFEQCFMALRVQTEESEGRLGYALGPDADFQFEQENDSLSEPELLSGLRIAAESLARTDPETWLAWVGKLGQLEVATAQRLIAHCFACYPEKYAKQALAFLLEDRRRLTLGSIADATGTALRLVKKASDHWTEEEIIKFEIAVEGYKPGPPAYLTEASDRRSWNQFVRRTGLSLLQALPTNSVTSKTRRHIEEEERVFPDSRIGSRSTGAPFIGSIMDSAMIARASDEDVINAFRTLPDASGWDHPRDWMVGGNIQLSREFATFAKEHPDRAIRLIESLEPEDGTRAAGCALEAMSEDAAPEQVFRLFDDLVRRGFDSVAFRGSASMAVMKLVGRKIAIGDDVVSILEGWLIDPRIDDPITDNGDLEADIGTVLQAANAESEDKEDRIRRSFLWGRGGSSMVPGGDYTVLEALIRIGLEREDFDKIDEMLRVYLGRCKDAKLWDSLLRFIPYLHPKKVARRAALLEQVFSEIPALVGTRIAAHLLAKALRWDAEFVDSQLDRWRDSRSPAARQAYGEMVAFAALRQPTLGWAQARLDTLIEDRAWQNARAGAALTAANLWSNTRCRLGAGDLLTRLLAGGDADVWRAAFELFRLTDELTPDSATVSLLTVIADQLGTAPRLDATFVVKRLGTLLPHQANLVGNLVGGLIGMWQTELGDISTGTAAAARELVDIAVTLHRLNPETREIGTALFERLLEVNAWEARKTMDEIDNRFLDQTPPRRRRRRRCR